MSYLFFVAHIPQTRAVVLLAAAAAAAASLLALYCYCSYWFAVLTCCFVCPDSYSCRDHFWVCGGLPPMLCSFASTADILASVCPPLSLRQVSLSNARASRGKTMSEACGGSGAPVFLAIRALLTASRVPCCSAGNSLHPSRNLTSTAATSESATSLDFFSDFSSVSSKMLSLSRTTLPAHTLTTFLGGSLSNRIGVLNFPSPFGARVKAPLMTESSGIIQVESLSTLLAGRNRFTSHVEGSA
mmetsp:Transcript_40572/g.79951  ORF Transcript_40572/g.79951 Transcript_40572/m.79951 type:complete len:243 (-) Transcript_40572:694-1422(-)